MKTYATCRFRQRVSLSGRMLASLVMLLWTAVASAEITDTGPATGQVKGKILNAQGQPLVAVTVTVEGTQRGTLSDAEGYYAIDAAADEMLTFRFLGFTTQQQRVPRSLTLDVVMREEVQQIEELVVVGMGHQARASVIGAVTTIDVADLKTPARSLTNALAGRLAGVVAVQRSGEPGYDNSDFWIRGLSTFGGNKTPLVLVDGVERDEAMANINPEEIESVSILKDASATAVYGVRAANGVVVITTRRGEVSRKPRIDLKMEYGISTLTRVPQLLGGVDYMNLYNEAAGSQVFSPERIEATRLGTDPYLYPDVDWLDEIYKDTSSNHQITLNVSGGGQVARYFVSFGNLRETGNYRENPRSEYSSNIKVQRYNFRTNVGVSVTKSTLLDIELGGYVIDGHYPGISNSSLYAKAYVANPVSLPVRYPYGQNEDGTTRYVWAGIKSGTVENPVERLMGSGYTTEYKNQLLGQVRLTQDFGKIAPALEGLKANVAFSFDAYNETKINRHKKDSYYLANGRNPETGELELVQTVIGDEYLGFDKALYSDRAMEFKAQVNYDRKIARNHNIGLMAMYYQRDLRKSANDAISSLPYRKQGLAFRATYNYDLRYFVEFNLGYNGSENFPKGERFGIFPAGAVGYLISEEKFWKTGRIADVISLLKFKGSVGLVGSEALPNNQRYAYLTLVGSGLGSYSFGYDPTGYGGTGENREGVMGLTWEKGMKANVGFQAEFFRKLTLEVDYFRERRTDILVQRASLPGILGLNSQPFANIGEMTNWGVDGTLEFNHAFRNLSLRVYANATYARNKVVFQDEPAWKYPYLNRTGKRYGQPFGLIALGYFESQEEIDASPAQLFGQVRPGDVKYLDVNGDGVVDSYDEVAIGHPTMPELLYGFGFQIGFKGLDLALFFRGQARVSYMLGGEGFVPFKEGGDRGNLFREALDRWTVENPRQDAFYPRLSIGNTENNYRASTKWQYDGSFLRLADLEIGYNFPEKVLKALRMQGLRVYFHGSNLALFSKFKMWDPELGKGRGDAYPLQRKFNFGVRVNF
ncbi:SusC/RagA family TonB-linked outer membrane protein [Alistipes sp.]|uniref:SusC/RagA family TonB-linked outer membrane protein n=1 Tax=Alistipes sp. TaxID=1872444 RepID=UPI003AF0EA77